VAESGIQPDGSWLPAFPGQAPPFGRGNTASLKHGAYAVVHLRSRADEIRDALAGVADLASPADGATLDVCASLLAQAERALTILEHAQKEELDAILAGTPLKPEERQNLARLSADTRGWLNSAMRALDRLGLSPLARARLGADVARMGESLVVAMQREAAARGGDGS
jgi:hypothetical protein